MKKLSLVISLLLPMLLLLCCCSSETKPVVFTLDIPLSGEQGDYAAQFLAGAEFAADWINENGGINGRELSLDIHDSTEQTSPGDEIVTATANSESLCLIGGMGTDDVMANAEAAQEASLPYLLLSTNIGNINELGDYVFSFYPSMNASAQFLCQQLFDARCVAVLYSNNFDGIQSYECFISAAAESGIEVFAEPINVADYNFGLIIEKLRQTNVDHVVIFTTGKETADFIALMLGQDWAIPVYIFPYETGLNLTDSTDIATGIPFTAYLGEDLIPDSLSTFSSGGSSLTSEFIEGFDLIWYLSECARNTPGKLTRSSFCESIQKLDGFCGLSGPISFDEDGAALRQLRLLVFNNGQWTVQAAET